MAIAEICEKKQCQKIDPALTTELELQRALMRQGVPFTAESFRAMLAELKADPDVITRRLLRYNGYELRNYANDTENNTQSISTSAKGA